MNMNSGGEINMKYEDTRAGTDERGIPRVYVKPWRYGLKFFCCYCKHVHRHGTGLGHRVAHCDREDSPYHERGYVLTFQAECPPPSHLLKNVFPCIGGPKRTRHRKTDSSEKKTS